MGRAGLGRGAAVTEGPVPGRRVPGREVDELHRKRGRAGGHVCGEIGTKVGRVSGDVRPPVIDIIQERDELGGGLPVACLPRVVVPLRRGIGGRVEGEVDLVLNRPVPPAVMVAGGRVEVVDFRVSAVRREDVVEIEDEDVLSWVSREPFGREPLVERPGVRGIGSVRERGGGDHHEEGLRLRSEVLEDVDVDSLRVCHGMVLRAAIVAFQGVVADRRHRVEGAALKGRVREAGFEDHDPVLSARVGGEAGVPAGGVLAGFVEEGGEVPGRLRAPEPRPPVTDVGGRSYSVGPPAVVGVADEVVVLPQGDAQPAVIVGKPVLAGGMVDEDNFDRGFRRQDSRSI